MNSINSSSHDSYEVESYQVSEMNLESRHSHTEDSSETVNAELYIDGIEELRTPFDYIFQGRSILPLDTLLDDALLNTEDLTPSKSCCSRLFSCFNRTLKNLQVSIKKVRKLLKTHFNPTLSFHGNLLMTWYNSVTGRNSFKLEQKIWQKIGFANEDPKANGLNEPGIVFVILHLLYMKTNCPDIMQSFVSCCLNPNFRGSLVLTSLGIMKFVSGVFGVKDCARYLQANGEKPLLLFIRLQTAMVAKWCNAFDHSTDKSSLESILKLARCNGKDIQQLLSISLS